MFKHHLYELSAIQVRTKCATTMRQVSSAHHVLILFSSSVWICQLLGTKKGEHAAKSRQLTTSSCIAPCLTPAGARFLP